ncbi:MAG: TraR/DksA C4-type zinc finger protein [Candidatus Melainabacteria bacterium]|nr:TraR/DksA C4-type zinc finger protein [Candidatus Melainabacteria bacterium]
MIKKNCSRCGKNIANARLEAMPETEICVRCSKVVGGEYDVIANPLSDSIDSIDLVRVPRFIAPIRRRKPATATRVAK